MSPRVTVRAVDVVGLEPGMVLESAVFTRHGVKLLSAGTELTDELCAALSSARGGLFYAEGAGELSPHDVAEDIARVRSGEKAEGDLVTSGGVLAVRGGELIERHHADAYEHGVFRPLDGSGEVRRHWAARTKIAESLLARRSESWERSRGAVERGVRPLSLRGEGEPGWPAARALRGFRDERVQMFRRMFGRILAGVALESAGLFALVDELVDLMVRFPDRFTQLALLTTGEADYLPDHGFSTSVLSVAIAARLGCDAGTVRLAGVSGLVADVGMGLVPRELREADRALTEVEVNRVRRHPAYSLVLLEEVRGLPEEVRRAAAQHHERENGSGYPRGIRSRKISDLARIVAVADAYAAATAWRPYRGRKRPYEALEELIHLGSSKVLDRRMVRALVESTGLFPVGSHVLLSTTETALVLASHAGQSDRPVVGVYEGHPASGLEVRDLTAHEPWELSIIKAIDAPTEPWPERTWSAA